ncbi:Glutamine amidotransferase, class I [hydrothermal vent metagenome]|uniref:Glutamine amidotransferase, class I n=1 Tax=hydrothermal vent metagenome TaxID=652676 RepID=A0A3B0W4Y3_9ZZZZ
MFLIIQTGDPVPAAINQFGRFSDWFIRGMAIENRHALTVDVHLSQSLPTVEKAIETLTGIIITGSPAMVTDRDDWLVKTQRWLNQSLAYNIPTLGVCFGHQLLADLLGGQVAYNPKGRNLGLSEFTLSNHASTDSLLQSISQHVSIPTFASHMQQVKTLPQSATLLGCCELDENHAFRAEELLWGVQFHPEWNTAITQTYIKVRSEVLIEEGADPAKMITQLQPCDESYGLLAKFAAIAEAHAQR